MKMPLRAIPLLGRFTRFRFWRKGGVAVLEIGLVLLISYMVSGTVTRILEDAAWQLPVLPAAPDAQAPKSTKPYALQYDPFYRTEPQQGAVQQIIPESSLKLKIHGLRSDGSGAGSAILQVVGDGGQKLVRVGGSVTKNVTLENVYADRVEIKRNGVLEAVYMDPKAVKNTLSVPHPVPQSVSQNKARGIAPSGLLAGVAGLDLTPVRENRRITGFMVGEAASAMALSLFSLEAEDILTAVDDMPLTSFERLQELPDEIAGRETITLHYERRGEVRSLRLKVK